LIAGYDPASSRTKDAAQRSEAGAVLDGSASSDGGPREVGTIVDASTPVDSQWLKAIHSPATITKPLVAVDSNSGRVIVALAFTQKVDPGNGSYLSSTGDADILLAAYDSAGKLLWKKVFGDATAQHPTGLAVDKKGNIVLAGDMGGKVNFGGGLLESAGGGDVFIASFSASGAYKWSKIFGLFWSERVYAFTVDGAGNSYLAGGTNKGQDFGGGNLDTSNDANMFLASFDSKGAHRWSKALGGDGPRPSDLERIEAMAFDEKNNRLLLAGSFDDTVDLGGSELVSAGGKDIFLASFSVDGKHLWSKRFGSTANDSPTGIAVDLDGNTHVVGDYSEAIDFGGASLPIKGYDTFLASFDKGGNHRWSRSMVSSSSTASLAVATNGHGDVLVTGEVFQVSGQTIDPGGGPLVLKSSKDAFFARYNTAGDHILSFAFGSDGADQGTSLASTPDGGTILVGTFRNSLTVERETVTSEGSSDTFLLYLPENLRP
ncbi:MAG: SBBP repeat-containing protein, partial [Lentisphaeria bacterium]|nr:SBBP repeat-containing protein [Lentisphaeria bacterium]